jgi:hypothetical protein
MIDIQAFSRIKLFPAGQPRAPQRVLFSFKKLDIVSFLKDKHIISIQLRSKHLVTFSVTYLVYTSLASLSYQAIDVPHNKSASQKGITPNILLSFTSFQVVRHRCLLLAG